MSIHEDSHVQCRDTSLKQLFDSYYGRLVYFSAHITGCRDSAEDIAQEAFIKYWNQKEEIASHQLAIKSFLYSTVKNASLNVVRHQQVRNSYAEYLINLSGQPVIEESMDDAIIHAEVLAELHQALDTLPASCQRISKMSYLEGMKNHEIAEALGISVNTVKTQKQRALQLLRLKLNSELYVFLLLMNL